MSKTYFLAPNRDTPPSGPIFLGSIIKSPREPEISLNGKFSPLLQDLEISETSLSNASRNLFRNEKGKVGVWTEFVNGVGVGGEISGNWDNVEHSSYKFEALITRTISPDPSKVLAMFKEEIIQMSLKNSRFKDNLYMVTGIKIARGADVVISKIRNRGGNLHFGIDTTPAGVPLKIGPDLKLSKKQGQDLKEHHDDDFVFAYRLREIVYARKEMKGQKEYLKGDLMGHGSRKEKETEKDDDDNVEAEFIQLKNEDVSGDAWDFDATDAIDDDEKDVVCVRVEDDEDD